MIWDGSKISGDTPWFSHSEAADILMTFPASRHTSLARVPVGINEIHGRKRCKSFVIFI